MSLYNITDVEIIADGLDHPECVALHSDGSIWAGGEAGQIYRINKHGSIEEVVNTGGFVLGIAFSPHGWLAICDLKKQLVWKYDLTTKDLRPFARGVEGRNFQTPNFPVFDNRGNLYVSDSGTFRQSDGVVFKFDANGVGTIWHEGPFSFANGLALSADQKKLYVVCTCLPGVEVVTINPDGSAGKKTKLIELPRTCPDGIAIDAADNLYISCYTPNTIYKLAASGKLETLIEDWESHTLCNPTNIAFGGPDLKDLYIANLGRWHIAKLKLDIEGVKLSGL